ncbi:tripartite tricarboxylate transporter permease [Microvirga pudoricolor]|uniref:tripartite tricarboxylate transporter permease n=1 Tax=Microvirga pudoricolor TaxID=2778729 RepID=UPI001950DB4D|nr:tripartite tricarboxylate transporter permease [Microvirga pudoricolor]MBM6595547.1 tripartite tricarboxylate transporter permease [Microvirga pudoricolor]
MNLLDNLTLGMSVALTFQNVFFCFVGVVVGTLVGVLPGLGPAATMAMLLPLTFYLTPVSSMIMLAGIYYGAQYGGSTTAILMRLPGEASSVVTCIDGHAMALKGRAGAALAIAALGSLFAGSVATLLIAVASPALAGIALRFGAPENFALMAFGLVGAIVLAQGSLLNAVSMVVLGLMLGIVGTDVQSGQQRFTLGLPQLFDGIAFVPLAMGLFGISDILSNLDHRDRKETPIKVGSLMPTKDELRSAAMPAVRGTLVGSILGVLPGGGALLSSFASYALEKKLAKDPSRFGQGAIEGVSGPESANNAGAQTSFIPMLTLGIPSNVVMAMIVGALLIQGIVPGPMIITQQPELFWGLIASMWIGNLMLVVINLPLVGVWVTMLRIPYRLLFPSVLLFCMIGAYSLSNSTFDIKMMGLFGAVGYLFHKLNCEAAPLLLGVILGPMMEENLRRALVLSRGDYLVFIEQPISLGLLLAALALLVLVAVPSFKSRRKEVFSEA